MNVIHSAWLRADNDVPNSESSITYAVLVSDTTGKSAFASIALSYFSEGVSLDQNTVGAAGAFIRGWTVVAPDGSENAIVNANYDVNSRWIDHCLLVTFELDVKFARAIALATVFID